MDTTNLANYLNSERVKRGWSMNEFGRRAGLSGAQIANIIGGRSAPGLEFFLGVAPALDVSLIKLLALAGHIPESPQDTPDPLLAEIWRLANALSPADRDAALRMLRGLRDGAAGELGVSE